MVKHIEELDWRDDEEVVGVTVHFKKREDHRYNFKRSYPIGRNTNDFNLNYTMTFTGEKNG